MTTSDRKTVLTMDVENLPRSLDHFEFDLAEKQKKAIFEEMIRLDLPMAEQLSNATKVLLSLSRSIIKRSDHIRVEVWIDKALGEFVVDLCGCQSTSLIRYKAETIKVGSAGRAIYLTQNVTVQIDSILFYTQQVEQCFAELEQILRENLEKRAKSCSMTNDEITQAWFGHIVEQQTSRVHIVKGRRGSGNPCVVSVLDRESVFEAKTKEHAMLVSILTGSRNLTRGVWADEVGDELYDTTGGYRGNKKLADNTLRNINNKIKIDTGLPYDLIEKKADKYVLNEKVTLL